MNSTDKKLKMSLTTQTILEDFFKANSYPIGCTVKIKGSSGVHIVREVFLEECEEPLFLYGTNRSAWHNHEDIKLVSLPSKESYLQLLQNQHEDEDIPILNKQRIIRSKRDALIRKSKR